MIRCVPCVLPNAIPTLSKTAQMISTLSLVVVGALGSASDKFHRCCRSAPPGSVEIILNNRSSRIGPIMTMR
jgi:hypothetical protein